MDWDYLFYHYPTAEERGETIRVSEQEFARIKQAATKQKPLNLGRLKADNGHNY